MKLFALAAGILLCCLMAGTAGAEKADEQSKAVTIPLKEIWAYDMPGTRNIRDLEPKLDARDPNYKDMSARSSVKQIIRFLATYVPDEGEWAETAFIVVGTDKEALKNAGATLKSREVKQQVRQFEKDTELSLVFFSYVTGWHPTITCVEKSRNLIKVKYQFISPEQPSLSAMRFALIPIGKLPAGTVKVEIEQVPPVDYRGRPVGPKRDPERYVCNSFEFDVK